MIDQRSTTSENIPAECVGAVEAARIVGLSRSTLAQMRMRRDPKSPPWFKPGTGKVLYPVAGLREWVNAQMAAASGGAR